MKCSHFLFLALATSLGSLAVCPIPASTAATPAQTQAQYSIGQFQGDWAVMANMGHITVMANKALGPASRLLVALPEDLKKIIGQDRFSLSRQSNTTWQGKSDDVTVTFSLVSENSAHLHVTGTGTHKLDLPLYRND